MQNKPEACQECPLREAPMVRGEGKIDGLGLVIMGEAPGREEVKKKRPFVGETGRLILDQLLDLDLPQNGCPISREGVYITNALLCRLNKADVSDKEVDEAIACCNQRREQEGELDQAKFIVGMGATAARALIGEKVVKTYRGAVMESPFGPCAITYHPTFILRGKKTGTRVQSDVYYQVVFQDVYKAYRMVDPQVPDEERLFRPAYDVAPPMEDVLNFIAWIRDNQKLCCVDIECDSIDPLAAKLTIIGFGAEVDGVVTVHAVPVWEGCGYTPEELDAFYEAFGALEADPAVSKLFHNFTYDVMVLERHGMPTKGRVEDTLLMHYALFPELTHDLQSVATSYLNIGPWKVNFRHQESERNKQYKALERWRTKAQEAALALTPFRNHSEAVEGLTGKKLASAFAELGYSEDELAQFKKARTAAKRADKRLAQIQDEIEEKFYPDGRDLISRAELDYNALDVACTLGAFLAMQDVEAEELPKLQRLYDTDIAVAEIARRMQRHGLPVIGDARTGMQGELSTKLAAHEQTLHNYVADVVDAASKAHPEWFDGRFTDTEALDAKIEDLESWAGAAAQDLKEMAELQGFSEDECRGAAPDDLSDVERQWYEMSMRDRACVKLHALMQAGKKDPKNPKSGFQILSGDHKSLLLDAYAVPVDELTPKTGKRRMTKDSLVKRKDEFAVVETMLDFSATHKLLKTFVEGKKIVIGSDGRIHPSWNSKGSTNPEGYGTVTGRWTSEPNVQNWPYAMRAMIGFPEDVPWTLVGADFSQLEFRILAWFAGETDLVHAFNEGPIVKLVEDDPEHAKLLEAWRSEKEMLKDAAEGFDVEGMKLADFAHIVPESHRDLWLKRILRIEKNAKGEIFIERDIHSATAVTIFGDQYTYAPLKKYKLLRNLTKRATYGGMYGGNAETLYNALHRDFPGTDKSQCEMFLEKFDRIWPNIVAWRKDSHNRAVREGELRTPLLGRCRLFPLRRPEATVAFNWPIQATAADIMNTSLLKLYNYVQARRDLRKQAFPIIQVHDAIYWEVREEIAAEFRSIVEEQMSRVLDHDTVLMSFPVEAKVGKKWSET